MKHIIIVCAGVVWSALAFATALFFGISAADAWNFIAPSLGAGIATSYAVTWIFRRHLVVPQVRKKYWLPFATIPSGVGIWTTLLFCVAAIHSLIRGRDDLFDGYLFVMLAASFVTLSVALPVTYPVAYLTQVLISRYHSSKMPNQSSQPTAASGRG